MLQKKDFAPILKSVLEKHVKPHILSNGFKKCGLFPWNPNSIESFFESYIGKDKLQAFRNTEEWNGQEVDKSLFQIWNKMTSDALGNVPFQEIFNNTQTSNTNPLQIIHNENELQVSVCSDPHSSDMSISENSPDNQISEPPPEAISQQNEPDTNISEKPMHIMNKESIPSPIKRSLFYPEENKSITKKKKEKFRQL